MSDQLEVALSCLSNEHKIEKDKFRYIGNWNIPTLPYSLMLFNIIERTHPKYNSTVAWKVQN
jgi:hypothetical protein